MARVSTARVRARRHADRRMCARTQALKKLNVFAFYSLVIIACFGVIATCLPEFRKLQASEEELAEVLEQKQAMDDRVDQQLREYRALEQDPYFLEIYGRDRLDMYKDGERIFRFSRDKKL
ncbi:FtsB family cell division protein [Rubritalea tangerina]|uniref:Septum formation initiator family protein n=1 Tax=Rubritalea tangerina TaxID=430798 RepID=A0ABW4Z6M3_9BACT